MNLNTFLLIDGSLMLIILPLLIILIDKIEQIFLYILPIFKFNC